MKCKFTVKRNFLVRTRETIELNPKDFIHCASIEELNNEVADYISNNIEHPNHPYREDSECLGETYFNNYWMDDSLEFYSEWQKLKGLPAEL